MSVWGTWWSTDADLHEVACSVFAVDAGLCDCSTSASPIAYQGSHILPSDRDPRAGSVDVAAVNTFVRRDGEDWPAEAETDAVHPWLRLSVNSETVILDLAQVTALCDTINEWMERVEMTE